MWKLKIYTLKNIKIITLAAGLLAITSFGQEDKRPDDIKKDKMSKMTPEQRAEKRTEKMAKTLSLTNDQAAKVKEINISHARQMAVLHTEMKALKEKVKTEKDGTRTKLDAVLTDEQKAIVKEKHEERKQKKAERRKDCCKE